MYRIGIDIGGTFTDLVAIDEGGRLRIAKTPSTPGDPSEGLLEGLDLLAGEYGITRADLLAQTSQIVHGTTVATNALLERNGARVGVLTTEGHRDVLEMKEGLKDDRYNVRMPPPEPLVPRRMIAGVRERMRFDGTAEIALSRKSLSDAIRTMQKSRADAVAVCYLHSYRNPAHEAATAREVRRQMPGVYVCTSSEILPQIKEFERFWTTAVNAYVGPVLGTYLTNLARKLQRSGYEGEVLVMQSHGGVATVRESVRSAVGAVLSGPAGGVAGGQVCARTLSEGSLITFDMGGTSTDIALMHQGAAALTGEKRVGIARIAAPSLDIHTLGAGGGSIARVFTGPVLRVGPRSAGAEPGPACYGRGGVEATVTDANLVLGYLDPDNFLGGRIRLDASAAQLAVERIADAMGIDRLAAAEGIHRVVNTNMAEGIRIVSVRRGVDPRRSVLVSFGGAAGLHVCEVASQLGINRVVVPAPAPVLSAWGMLGTDLRYEMVRSHVSDAGALTAARLRGHLGDLEREGRRRLGRFEGPVQVRCSLDMRYGEQIFEVAVSLEGLDLAGRDLISRIIERFHRRHEELYAYSSPGQEVVIVNVHVAVVGALPGNAAVPAGAPEAGRRAPGAGTSPVRVSTRTGAKRSRSRRRVYLGGRWREIPVHPLMGLEAGTRIDGPAIVESDMTTVLIRKGENLTSTPRGWLDIQI